MAITLEKNLAICTPSGQHLGYSTGKGDQLFSPLYLYCMSLPKLLKPKGPRRVYRPVFCWSVSDLARNSKRGATAHELHFLDRETVKAFLRPNTDKRKGRYNLKRKDVWWSNTSVPQ